jgi:hypothetical protein
MSALIDDRRVVSDRFLELVLADPDLLDAAFAAVEASWSATPPAPPSPVATRTGRPGPGTSPPRPAAGPARARSAAGPTGRYRTARAPPERRDPMIG